MQLIKKIEINYLRSIYSASLDRVGDLNLFFGRNDSGKSNVLRALNLFFNDETDPGQRFDFTLDMSDIRKKKAAEAKGRQFIWIKVTFNVPENYQKSLGKEISVKKQWNRDNDVTMSSSPSFSGGKAGRLSRFLNEIDFTYIPAIKDLNVYADLIQRMYASAAENDDMLGATNTFIAAISDQTATLISQLETVFGGSTRLSAPTDMATLFRNLDFSHGEEGHSLFKQKGDGIKARHLPELLRFINDSEARKRFFLWGFEEPENSLDLSAASEEASRFAGIASRVDTQIFITSHSSAFYLAPTASDCIARRYFITKQSESIEGDIIPTRANAQIDKLDDADRLMNDAGLLQLPYVIRKLEEFSEDRRSLEAEVEGLRNDLSSLQRPTVFLEGPHDMKFYPKFLNKIGISVDCDFKILNGTPSSSSAFLSEISKAGGLSASSKTLFVFDNDKSGRSSLKALCGKSADTSGESCVKISQSVWATIIPLDSPNFQQFMQATGVKAENAKFPFELLLADEEIAAWLNNVVASNDEWRDAIHNDYYQQGQKLTLALQKYEPGSLAWLYARMVPESQKDAYLEHAMNTADFQSEYLMRFGSLIAETIG